MRGCIVFCAVLTPQLVSGQAGTVAGTVITEGSGTPISGVQIVAGTHGASTDVSGRFRILQLTGDSVTLTLRRIGFAPLTQRVPVGATNLQLRMRERAVELNSMVVTGTPGAVSKRSVGVSVAQIQAADIVKTAPVQDVQGLINGRAPGVTVLENSGAVGSGATVRIRGGSSLFPTTHSYMSMACASTIRRAPVLPTSRSARAQHRGGMTSTQTTYRA